MPAASAWVTSMPLESPEPTYKPSQRRISTQALAARDDGVFGRIAVDRHAADALADVGMHGDARHLHAGLDDRERVGGVPGARLLPVRMLTAGPKSVTPASWQTSSWSLGHRPASRRPSHSSSPCTPITNSPAMPTSMPALGVLLAHVLDGAQRAEEVGVAGAAGGVEVDAVGAGLDHALADVDEVLAWRSSIASSMAARAPAMSPRGSSSNQFSAGPSGLL